MDGYVLDRSVLSEAAALHDLLLGVSRNVGAHTLEPRSNRAICAFGARWIDVRDG